ncbi:MAG: hypothetical protein RLZZ387_3874 [Chloroflexota bacterium]|jgi:hypothetical protein
MPNVRKLSHEEVRTIERKTLGQRKATELEYDIFLRDFTPGDYGEALLEPTERRLTVRSRLKAAAARHQPPLVLVFPRSRDAGVIRFKVAAAGAPEPAVTALPVKQVEVQPIATDAPPAVRRGRKPKAAPEQSSPAAPAKRGRKPKGV